MLYERWAQYVDIDTGCWLWRGTRTQAGYGHFNYQNRTYIAHRVAHEFFKGPIHPDLVIDHLCRTPACVNPSHLEAVTQRENVRRGKNGTKGPGWISPCPHGHSARRHCKQCLASKMRYWRKQQKDSVHAQ